MPDRVYIEGSTESGFTKRLAYIDLEASPVEVHSCCDDHAVTINHSEDYIEIDVTELPKELKTIRIQLT